VRIANAKCADQRQDDDFLPIQDLSLTKMVSMQKKSTQQLDQRTEPILVQKTEYREAYEPSGEHMKWYEMYAFKHMSLPGNR